MYPLHFRTMDKVHSIEHSLFEEWTKWLQKNKPEHGFTYDGVLCRESWIDAKKHILFLLKDVNNVSDSFNLRYYILNGVCNPDNWRTWDNVARWAYGLMQTEQGYYPDFSEADKWGFANKRVDALRQVAVVDIKKKPGKNHCTKKMLEDYFHEYPESYTFIAKQISLYGKLDYIVCCGDGVYEILLDIIKQENTILSNYFGRDLKYIARDKTLCAYRIAKSGTIIIDYRHPLLLEKGVNKRNVYLRLMNIAQDALANI